MKHCLDAWAILAWLDGEEPAASFVEELVEHARPAVNWINLVEVEYRVRRDHGAAEAEDVLADLRELVEEDLPGIMQMRAVAALKAEHPIALADCFAIATATSLGALLVTGDPEILERSGSVPCEVLDARELDR